MGLFLARLGTSVPGCPMVLLASGSDARTDGQVAARAAKAALLRVEIPSRGKAYRAHAVLHRLFASFRLAVVVAAPGGT